VADAPPRARPRHPPSAAISAAEALPPVHTTATRLPANSPGRASTAASAAAPAPSARVCAWLASSRCAAPRPAAGPPAPACPPPASCRPSRCPRRYQFPPRHPAWITGCQRCPARNRRRRCGSPRGPSRCWSRCAVHGIRGSRGRCRRHSATQPGELHLDACDAPTSGASSEAVPDSHPGAAVGLRAGLVELRGRVQVGDGLSVGSPARASRAGAADPLPPGPTGGPGPDAAPPPGSGRAAAAAPGRPWSGSRSCGGRRSGPGCG
jgi:hypothetical protein